MNSDLDTLLQKLKLEGKLVLYSILCMMLLFVSVYIEKMQDRRLHMTYAASCPTYIHNVCMYVARVYRVATTWRYAQ